jgi:hypothetical protein
MSKVIATEIITLDGTDEDETYKSLTRSILDSSSGGSPVRAIITVVGGAIYVNRFGDEPVIATGNYEVYGNNGRIIIEGYDNMAAVVFGQLTDLQVKLFVIYEN